MPLTLSSRAQLPSSRAQLLSSRAQRGICISALLLIAPTAWAQCPDGSAPPCSTRVASASRPVDPNRIAVFPFRVAASDTLLGEGFAELLATEFSSDDGPRAIDMATVISAWRRAGGGLRTPLPRERALSLARELGAGLVGEGSIVGLGGRITITTNLVNSTNGTTRGRPTVVRASSDSIDHALRQTASGLVAALGGQQRTLEGARFTESPEAMRAYLEGLSLWRRGRLHEGQKAFERAMTMDTSFAQAAFRRYLVGTWALGPGTITQAEAVRRMLAFRARLSVTESQLVDALYGSNANDARTIARRLPALTQIAEARPDSPEAQFALGDAWFHHGIGVDHVNQLAKARYYIDRAVAIDSVAPSIRHLIEIDARMRDTSRLRSVLAAYARTEDAGRWGGLYLGYAILGDDRQLALLRAQNPGPFEAGAQWATGAAAVADISAARLDEMHRYWLDAARGTPFHALLGETYGMALLMRDRPAAAESIWAGLEQLPASNTAPGADRWRIWADMSGHGAGLDVVSAMQRLMLPNRQPQAAIQCETTLWRLTRGVPTEEDSRRPIAGAASCQRSVRLARMLRDSATLSFATVASVDSTAWAQINGQLRAFDAALLTRAWLQAGRPDRAYATSRFRAHGTFTGDSPWIIPEEIRLALVVRDTAHAIRMLEYYLPIVQDAEPLYVPKRDSLRALLNQLRRR